MFREGLDLKTIMGIADYLHILFYSSGSPGIVDSMNPCCIENFNTHPFDM